MFSFRLRESSSQASEAFVFGYLDELLATLGWLSESILNSNDLILTIIQRLTYFKCTSKFSD